MDKPVEFSFTVHPICLPKKPNTDIDSIKNIPATLSGYGSKSGKTSTVIHYSPLTIMGQKECEERHFVDLKTSNSEFGQALWRQVQLILDSERKISNELVCTKAPIEELGTCPGGCKIDKHSGHSKVFPGSHNLAPDSCVVIVSRLTLLL